MNINIRDCRVPAPYVVASKDVDKPLKEVAEIPLLVLDGQCGTGYPGAVVFGSPPRKPLQIASEWNLEVRILVGNGLSGRLKFVGHRKMR